MITNQTTNKLANHWAYSDTSQDASVNVWDNNARSFLVWPFTKLLYNPLRGSYLETTAVLLFLEQLMNPMKMESKGFKWWLCSQVRSTTEALLV